MQGCPTFQVFLSAAAPASLSGQFSVRNPYVQLSSNINRAAGHRLTLVANHQALAQPRCWPQQFAAGAGFARQLPDNGDLLAGEASLSNWMATVLVCRCGERCKMPFRWAGHYFGTTTSGGRRTQYLGGKTPVPSSRRGKGYANNGISPGVRPKRSSNRPSCLHRFVQVPTFKTDSRATKRPPLVPALNSQSNRFQVVLTREFVWRRNSASTLGDKVRKSLLAEMQRTGVRFLC